MKFMNDYDRDNAIRRFTRAGVVPNRLGLALLVDALANWTDSHSDGWAYWPKPCRAASNAIALVESTAYPEYDRREREDVTDAEMLAAARPVKAFCTRMVNAGKMTTDDRDRIVRNVEVLS